MNSINEHFNSKIIKNLFNNNINIKYTNYELKEKDYYDSIFNTDNDKFNINNILDQFNFLKSNLYLQYTELFNKDAIKKIYSNHNLSISNIIKCLKDYGIDNEIINKENIVLSIIKNINTYMKKLDICVNKIVTGNFTNDTDNTIFSKFINVHDNDIEEIKYNKNTQDLMHELYNKIKTNEYALIITNYNNNYVIFFNNTEYGEDKISVQQFINNISLAMKSDLDLLKNEWNLCKENMEYISILNYKIPYYTVNSIKNIYDCIRKIFDNGTLKTRSFYSFNLFQEYLEYYLNHTNVGHIYLIKYNENIPKNKHNNIVSYKLNHAIYNLKRNPIGSYSNILVIIINFINRIRTNNDILNKELQNLLKEIKEVRQIINNNIILNLYNQSYNVLYFNFNEHLLYMRIMNFFNNIVYPKISLLYNEYKNISPQKVDYYLKYIKQYIKACKIFYNRVYRL